MQSHHTHVPHGGFANHCMASATASVKHHQWDVSPPQELRRRSGASCMVPGVAVTHGRAISTGVSTQGSHTSRASSVPKQSHWSLLLLLLQSHVPAKKPCCHKEGMWQRRFSAVEDNTDHIYSNIDLWSCSKQSALSHENSFISL